MQNIKRVYFYLSLYRIFYKNKAVIYVCPYVSRIITLEPLNQFASNFDRTAVIFLAWFKINLQWESWNFEIWIGGRLLDSDPSTWKRNIKSYKHYLFFAKTLNILNYFFKNVCLFHSEHDTYDIIKLSNVYIYKMVNVLFFNKRKNMKNYYTNRWNARGFNILGLMLNN